MNAWDDLSRIRASVTAPRVLPPQRLRQQAKQVEMNMTALAIGMRHVASFGGTLHRTIFGTRVHRHDPRRQDVDIIAKCMLAVPPVMF